MVKRERTVTVGLPSNQGPAVISVPLRDMEADHQRLEAWIGNFGSSNVWVFHGDVTLAQAQQIVKGEGEIDCVFALTEAGPVSTDLASTARRLTVFFEARNEVAQTQAVCLKVIEIFEEA